MPWFARDDSRWNEAAFLLYPRLSGSKYSPLKSELRCIFWSLTFNTTLPNFPIPTSLTALYHRPMMVLSIFLFKMLLFLPCFRLFYNNSMYPSQRSIWNQYIWWIRVETTTITTCSTGKFLLLVFIITACTSILLLLSVRMILLIENATTSISTTIFINIITLIFLISRSDSMMISLQILCFPLPPPSPSTTVSSSSKISFFLTRSILWLWSSISQSILWAFSIPESTSSISRDCHFLLRIRSTSSSPTTSPTLGLGLSQWRNW